MATNGTGCVGLDYIFQISMFIFILQQFITKFPYPFCSQLLMTLKPYVTALLKSSSDGCTWCLRHVGGDLILEQAYGKIVCITTRH